MPPSQLKRLKTSLREAGITGPQKSKKQRKPTKTSSNSQQRHETLQNLRDSFNPFELRATSSRPTKFQHATNGAPKRYKDVLHRPGVSKSAGEEMRRAKLLPEMQRRNKVGGLVDRRIGEGDMSMTAEERAVQRFAAEKGRKRGKSLFNLEGSDDDEGVDFGLTHGGRALDDLPADDFGEDMDGRAGSAEDEELVRRKRRRSDSDDEIPEEDNHVGHPEHKKSKKEVMQEVIAKSKLHKYERQKAKEDDDDLRDELDKGMDDVLALLRGHKAPQPVTKPLEPVSNGTGPKMNPDRLKLLEGMDREQADRDYDVRLKQLAQDAKAKPSERSKTEEEKIREEAARLKDLENRRLRRMRGDEVSEEDADTTELGEEGVDVDFPDEAAQFGFTTADMPRKEQEMRQIVLEGEDEFALDDNLVASASDLDASDEDSELSNSEGESTHEQAPPDEEDDDFVKDMLTDVKEAAAAKMNGTPLAYTYACPRSHDEFLDVLKDTAIEQLPTIIQRIRALHHPSLNAGNKEAVADFASVLVEHLSYMGGHKHPLHITEQVIRHLHSLSRTYPQRIAEAFRAQLTSAHDRKDLQAGDLVIFIAIGNIYPTSDHWHQVVTPAITLMARWLDLNAPDGGENGRKGAYLASLCVNFQRFSKRLVPEAMRFTVRALNSKFQMEQEERKAHVQNLMAMAELWKDKTAFIELFAPCVQLLKKTGAKREHQTLQILLRQSRIRRRPLELHHHRPLPIRTSVPKFEEGFNPDKHYDPDKERSDSRKLQKEYKRERKGALRELRKDANFVSREKLREKRERDAEYEKKQRRLVAEIQGEAGHDAREWEREKAREKSRSRGKGRR